LTVCHSSAESASFGAPSPSFIARARGDGVIGDDTDASASSGSSSRVERARDDANASSSDGMRRVTRTPTIVCA